MIFFELPNEIRAFVRAHNRVVQRWKHHGLRFTLDGRLVGDIAEMVAAENFDLVFPSKRTPGVDLICGDGKTVQVKASGLGKGPAFSPGVGRADYLIFMLIDFQKCRAQLIYNGPEAPVRAKLPAEFSSTKRVPLLQIINLDKEQSLRLALKANSSS